MSVQRHQAFPDIGLLHNVVKRCRLHGAMPPLMYRAKIKLHGTNSAVQLEGTQVLAQSRSAMLDASNGLYGFREWVERNKDVLRGRIPVSEARHASASVAGASDAPAQRCEGLARANECNELLDAQNLTLFGEWCGLGIQRGVALSKLDRKVWAVFAALVSKGEHRQFEVRPEVLATLLPEHPDIFVLPWFSEDAGASMVEELLEFDTEMEGTVARINQLVQRVEQEDPWVKQTFGLSGTGEGLVWYPRDPASIPDGVDYQELLFKSKGGKHA
ncbi:MAG: RNA ligase family protein, partial [Myxococcota bacterium]|nr:RNA ligase family protein [Myxococcota bacterium]